MRQPDEFDEFYKDARDRLLAQTYAMTGDLGASRRAVRDAFAVAWQRWRKLSRLERPEDVVRPHAWRLAQRRHTARVWHRERDIDPDVRATLDALGKLSTPQRKALVLTQLAAVSMPQMAREIGLTLERAEIELQAGTTALSLEREVQASELRAVFDALATSVQDRGRFPRAPIVRRTGNTRRRGHTLLGAVGAVAALVVTGSLVTDAGGVRPTLHAQPDKPARTPAPVVEAEVESGVTVTLPDTALLDVATIETAYPGRTWSERRTVDNSEGSGMVLPCQVARYADPAGTAALVRTFRATADRQPAATAVQLTEASARPRAAQRTFRATTAWFAGCTDQRVQLLATRTPTGVGDDAVQLVLRSFAAPVTTYVVGVARTGLFTTTTVVETPGDDVPDRDAAAAVLAAGVGGLCALPGAGACAPSRPTLADREPVPAGRQPALVSEIDLPPVSGVDDPWVGTEPRRATTNAAATGCDTTSFAGRFGGARFTRNATRTFLVPGADLPREFGLTETVGALPAAGAAGLVEQVRDRLASCPERELNTDVERLVDRTDGADALTAWRLEVRVTDERTVTYLMAVIRTGTSVAQLTFVPTRDASIGTDVFVDLAERAQARLRQLPAPDRG
ncbi:hypothetical protein FE634_06615 [Nocardioides dongxiaopingii]|uniref:hypothetical protein n=1 Tax=Nocardioides sp. S-1144 TaxID=2582905 RepID=UPI00110E2795|nr:hypothetical protein [Nocardioides sp. S-1144]QCW50162.1 hypothetical protein FE634_06615 [Nocardioides sp. S-1144]